MVSRASTTECGTRLFHADFDLVFVKLAGAVYVPFSF